MKSSSFSSNSLRLLLAGASLFAVVLALTTSARAADNQPAALVERGRYLVESVGMCADCHSPRGERGAFVKERWLQGAPLGFAPTVPVPVWASMALPIAGLPSMTSGAAKTFFMTGKRPDGSSTRPPMPEYRFDGADAEAIVAYLKTLKPATS